MADKPRHLLSGYAAGVLDRDEHHDLMAAALEDQDVFDRLVEEESWRRIFNAPGMRRELLEALDEPSLLSRMFSWLRLPQGQVAMGTLAMSLMMAVVVPTWMNSRSVDPLTSGPATPGPAIAGPAASGTTVPMTRSLAKDTPDKYVAKGLVSDEYKSKSIPGAADVRSLSFGLELLKPTETRPVAEGYRFEAGDEFRVHLNTDFPAWVYLFNRAEGDDVYTVIYPRTTQERVSRQGNLLVPAAESLAMDETPDDERLVLVVSTAPWSLLEGEPDTIAYQALEDALAHAESELASASWRRFIEGEQVHLKIADPRGELLFVERLLAE